MNTFKYVLWFLFASHVYENVARQNHTKNMTHYVQIFTRTDRIVNCIARLAENMTEPYNLIMVDVQWRMKGFVNSWKFKNASLVLHMGDNNLQKISSFKRMNNFMLLLDDIVSFNVWLQDVRKFHFWNPKGKFIVAMLKKENITEILELAWKYYIVNINVILLFDLVPMVYTYFPYKTGNCNNPVHPELLMTCENNIPLDPFPKKIPRSYNGCAVRLLVYHMPPFVLNVSGDENNASAVGLEVIIMKTLAHVLHFTEVYVPHNYTSWGTILHNGSYTNMLNDMYHRKADVMFGLMVPSLPTSTDFDFTMMHIIEGLTWWVATPSEQPGWINLLMVFKPLLWISICSMLTINSVIWWLIGKNREPSHYFSTFSGTFFANLCIVLQGVIPQPKGHVMRLLYMGSVMYSILIYAAYQSQLISSLTTPRYEHQINNLDELLESGMSYGFSAVLEELFKSNVSEQYTRVAQNYVHCPLNETCLNRTAFHKDFAVFKNIRQTLYMIKKYYTRPDGSAMIIKFDEMHYIFPKYLVSKGFPLLDKIDNLIMQLHSNGLIPKWDKELAGIVNTKPASSSRKRLTMSHLASGFLYLLIGYIVSIVVLLIEILHKIYSTPSK